MSISWFYRNDEGNRVDHLQKKRHLEDLLPNVPLKSKTCTDAFSGFTCEHTIDNESLHRYIP